MLIQEIYSMGLAERPKKERKPKLRKLWYSGKCRKCGLPKKPEFSTARKLTRFETDTCTDTAQNKKQFDSIRRDTYCNSDTCYKDHSPAVMYNNFMDLAEDFYGTRELTKRQKREFTKMLNEIV